MSELEVQIAIAGAQLKQLKQRIAWGLRMQRIGGDVTMTALPNSCRYALARHSQTGSVRL